MKNFKKIALLLAFVGTIFSQSTFGDQDAATITKGDADWSDGLISFRTQDGNFGLRFDVRGYIDYGMYLDDDDDYFADGWNFRRARFALKAQLWKNWFVEYDTDVAENAVEIKDLYIMRKFENNFSVKVGHFKPAFSLEELTSSSKLSFLERAMINEWTPGRRPGIGLTYYNDQIFASTTLFGMEMGDRLAFADDRDELIEDLEGDLEDAEDDGDQAEIDRLEDEIANTEEKFYDETWGYAARVAYFPINEEGKVVHVGVSYMSESLDHPLTGSKKFDFHPEARVSEQKFLYAKVGDADSYNYTGFELAGQLKGLSFQGEYMMANVLRSDADLLDVSFSGYYVYGSYFLFGGQKQYKASEAEFGQIEFFNKNEGALEALVRYSSVDLNADDEVKGDKEFQGQAGNITLGLNWYPNYNIRIMANYTIVDNDNYARGKKGKQYVGNYDFSVFQTRFVFVF